MLNQELHGARDAFRTGSSSGRRKLTLAKHLCSVGRLACRVVPMSLALLPAAVIAQQVLPRPDVSVPQKIGRTAAESGPARWPDHPRAMSGAPNVLLIMTDDAGFACSSAFGGLIPTPTLDRLAKDGVRHNQFNTTAICSPTRASLLTGREPHNVAMGNVNNFPTGYDGYTTEIPKSAGMLPEILRQSGYSTASFGKWHLTPEWEMSAIGPFDRWPTGAGFDYFYGFQGADTDQFAPALFENTVAVPPPEDPNYILDRDLADHAIKWIGQQHEVAPDKPFFVYYAPGSTHSPHSAPQEWLDKFKGKFDAGWDVAREQIFARQKAQGIIPAGTKLTPRPSFLPAWSSLSPERKRLYARMMEAYAAALAYSDHEIGRVIEHLRATDQIDNTLIIFIEGDNGASAEGGKQGLMVEEAFINNFDESFDYLTKHIDDIGGPKAHNHYPAAWGWAMGTPFQYYKQVASHFGGIRNGMVVSWPQRIKQVGVVSQQFEHVSDVAPTILEAAGITPPTVLNGVPQKPLDGISFAYTFDNYREPSRRHTQVFEMVQNLGIYDDGWWAGTRPQAAPWDITKVKKLDLDSRQWELYHVAVDYSQSKDLAAAFPEKLAQMQRLFFAEAAKNNILPIHSIGDNAEGRPTLTANRTIFTYKPGITRLAENSAPRIIGRSYKITADIVAPENPVAALAGVLVTQGGRFGGYAFYVEDGKPVFHYNATGERQYRIAASEALTRGQHRLVATFVSDEAKAGSPGTLTISVDGRVVATGRIENTHRTWISNSEGFDVGEDTLTPINDDYTIGTSKFTGELKQVTIELQ